MRAVLKNKTILITVFIAISKKHVAPRTIFHFLFCRKNYVLPRVLSCLHVFCEGCLDKMLLDETGDSTKIGSGTIVCPDCQQPTKVSDVRGDFGSGWVFVKVLK